MVFDNLFASIAKDTNTLIFVCVCIGTFAICRIVSKLLDYKKYRKDAELQETKMQLKLLAEQNNTKNEED